MFTFPGSLCEKEKELFREKSKPDLEKHIWMARQMLLSSKGRRVIKTQRMAAAPPAAETFTMCGSLWATDFICSGVSPF